MRQEVRTKAEIAPYELKLPSLFDVKPIYTVELPAKCKALIFDKMVPEEDYNGDGKRITVRNSGWKVVIVNSKGNRYFGRHTGYHDSDFDTTDPLKVQFHLKAWALNLSKSKKTTVEVNDPDDE